MKQCKIQINREGADLFYTAFITKMTDTHIFFVDKFNKEYVFKMADVVEIKS